MVIALLCGVASSQSVARFRFDAKVAADNSTVDAGKTPSSPAVLTPVVTLPRMAPELALQVFHGRSLIQAQQLAAYTAVTEVHAELPETDQKGDYKLQRHFQAPHTLEFTALDYRGDGFVKSNVIARLLQSEVDHVKQDDGEQTAISEANYKFSYKGTSEVNGRLVHIFHVKPRKKRPGLFKGRIALDAYLGSLVRAEGTVVKSPSFFVKKIEFMQDYVDIAEFTFPAHIHSVALARVIGHTVVDVYHSDYQPVTSGVQSAQQAAAPTTLSSSE